MKIKACSLIYKFPYLLTLYHQQMSAITVPIDNWKLELGEKGFETYLGLEDRINDLFIRLLREAKKNHKDHIDIETFTSELNKIKVETKGKLIQQAIKREKIPYDRSWRENIDMFITSAKSFTVDEMLRNMLVAMWNDPRSQVFLKSATLFKPEILLSYMPLEEQIQIYLKFYKLHHDDFRYHFKQGR